MGLSVPAAGVQTWGQSHALVVLLTGAGGVVQVRVSASEGQPRLARK